MLWKSDGSDAGTTMLPGSAVTYLNTGAAVGDTAYFVTSTGSAGYTLSRSDGTDTGTFALATFPGNLSNPWVVQYLTPANGQLFFEADDGVSGSEIWKTDGTVSGTMRVTDIWPGVGGSNPRNLTAVGGQLFFIATDPSHGYALWTTDGTSGGTRLLHDFSQGTADAATISRMTVVNGRLVFSTLKNELWTSDGTPEGTIKLRSFQPYFAAPDATSVGAVAYFTAIVDAAHDAELWRTDGTDAGTAKVSTLPGTPTSSTVAGGDYYYEITSPLGQNQIWWASPDGSVLLHDVDSSSPGIPQVSPGFASQFAVLGRTVIAAGGSQTYGSEPAREVFFDPSVPAAALAGLNGVINFGTESVNTTSLARTFTLSNLGSVPVSILSIDATAGFQGIVDCPVIPAGGTCTVSVTYTPSSSSVGPLQTGSIVVHTDAGSYSMIATGGGDHSLVEHYYESILRREPDSAGKTFWQNEASRVTFIGADLDETWYAMAMSFYSSPEYAGFGRNPTEYVRDLYNTFFNRTADDAGLAYWTGLMAGGMSREAVLTSFMFSPEFANFTTAIFGSTTARPEANMVMDFYRGLLSRLPDSAGFSYYLGKFQGAQCGGASTVVDQVQELTKAFLASPEYVARNRTDDQYVADLYNAFMRRGPDLDGFNYYVAQLGQGLTTREALRQTFVASPEFSARVTQVMAAGCGR
jgi:ELWxxDGT repeat protein